MPLNFPAAKRTQLLRFLQYGRGSAINAPTIAAHLGYPVSGNQVKTRDLIRECIEHNHDLIASTLKKPRGFYKIRKNNMPELNEYLDSLESRAKEINLRRTHLINNWNTSVSLNPTNKQILPY